MQKTDERVAYGALISEKVGSAQQGFSGALVVKNLPMQEM